MEQWVEDPAQTLTKNRKKDDTVILKDLEVSFPIETNNDDKVSKEEKNNERDANEDGDAISDNPDKTTPLLSEVVFLWLSLLSAVASIFVP